MAALAGAYLTPVAAHDCNGPVVLSASVHFCQATPNAYVQEIVRAFYYGWYAEIVTELPPIVDGPFQHRRVPGWVWNCCPISKSARVLSLGQRDIR
ncbi:MAG: hypothetical protein Ct9H300mP14_00820 [Gammaproteobacteria bacterium]|nr:MAG: hypothetical protein Ct9H300mP14_00820 [Gammaproteobacteria bacterium]